MNKEYWGYCFGEENLVDIGLCGVFGLKFGDDKLWWCGLQWLLQGEEKWLVIVEDICMFESEEELKKMINVMVV